LEIAQKYYLFSNPKQLVEENVKFGKIGLSSLQHRTPIGRKSLVLNKVLDKVISVGCCFSFFP
jgi:hypothetical protein